MIYFLQEMLPFFRELEGAPILLSPHGISTEPLADPENIAMNNRIGMFNAGLVGASRSGRPLLEWWAAAILQQMERDESLGVFADQRYLDLSWLYFDENVHILRHKAATRGAGIYIAIPAACRMDNCYLAEKIHCCLSISTLKPSGKS